MTPYIKIGNRKIKRNQQTPFIIAEAGVNYFDIAKKLSISTLSAAKLMIKEAANAGADAIKFQSYKAETLAAKYSPAYWDTKKEQTKSQYLLFKKFDSFGKNEYETLATYAKKFGIVFMSTPFDDESANYLNRLMPAYKIASADITNFPLLKKVASKKKPIILSTGASYKNEIDAAVNFLKKCGCHSIVLLHCILNYPTENQNANLAMIKDLSESYPNLVIGYSDHTLPDKKMLILTTAFLYGATIIEKHFTLDKTLPGNDHYHAMDPSDLVNFIQNISLLKTIRGSKTKKPIPTESGARRNARRSLYATRLIPIGKKISHDDIIPKRPAHGISPTEVHRVVGSYAKKNIQEDESITWIKLLKAK